jgi:hypothetical protein
MSLENVNVEPRRAKLMMYGQRAVTKLLLVVSIGVLLVGSLFGILGVILVYKGATGTSHFSLFGQTVETASVGVASLFIGAVVVVILIRQVMKTVHEFSLRKY